MGIEAIDHWVLVVKDLEETFAFYRKLGLEAGWQERPGGRGTRRAGTPRCAVSPVTSTSQTRRGCARAQRSIPSRKRDPSAR